MDKEKFFKCYFWAIGVYDVLLGGAFVLFFEEIYKALHITLPNHPGYIYVPAMFLVSGGIGEFLIARNPLRNVDLVVVRLLMKASFAGAVLYCYVRYGVPAIFLIISLLSVMGIVKNLLFLNWAKSINTQ
ncbi:MAG: hypothetical protein WC450_05345 [Candidatus Omnitrophota bacterium]|jgi:hypothetical protein